jgi:hypothetical protein
MYQELFSISLAPRFRAVAVFKSFETKPYPIDVTPFPAIPALSYRAYATTVGSLSRSPVMTGCLFLSQPIPRVWMRDALPSHGLLASRQRAARASEPGEIQRRGTDEEESVANVGADCCRPYTNASSRCWMDDKASSHNRALMFSPSRRLLPHVVHAAWKSGPHTCGA